MQTSLKYFLVAVLVVLLFLPAIQFQFNFPQIENTWLAGKTEEISKPLFSIENWLNESYQKNLSAFLESRAGYKPWLIRFTNEWQFRFFKDADNDVIVGKENWLFGKPYIESYLGKDIINYDTLSVRIKRARRMQTLFDHIGKKSLFIMAPGKASYMNEYIPERYIPSKSSLNNYSLLKSAFEKDSIEYLDLYQYFLSQKSTAQYSLFPKYGTHWSIYGSYVAMDSIVHYLRNHTTYKPGKYIVDRIEVSNHPRGTDKDLLEMMNIFSELPSPPLAYPIIARKTTNPNLEAPNILVIGDSYMWTFYQCGIMPLIAGANTRYWYYGNTVFDFNIRPTGIKISNLNLKEEIDKFDIILFVFTETDQANFDFNMTEKIISALERKGNEPN